MRRRRENGSKATSQECKVDDRSVHDPNTFVDPPHESVKRVEEEKAAETDGEARRESLITKEYVVSLLKAESGQSRQRSGLEEGKPMFKRCATHAGLAYYINFNRELPPPSREISQPLAQSTNNKEKLN